MTALTSPCPNPRASTCRDSPALTPADAKLLKGALASALTESSSEYHRMQSRERSASAYAEQRQAEALIRKKADAKAQHHAQMLQTEAKAQARRQKEETEARPGRGRVVALHHRSSTSYHISEHVRGPYF